MPGMTRSEIMSRIRSKDTKMEVAFRKALWGMGLRFRKHHGECKIDITFPRERVALMLDGCFWHGCPRHYREPGSNTAYWRTKMERNRARDRKVRLRLERDGWRVLRLWECEIQRMLRSEAGVRELARWLGLLK